MRIGKHIRILLLSFLIFGCHEDSLRGVSIEEALVIMKNCKTSQLKEPAGVAENLVGTWQLIAYGCGLCMPHEAPMVTVSFKSSTGTMVISEDPVLGNPPGPSKIQFDWFVEIDSTDEVPRLLISPEYYAIDGLAVFCSDYMYYDHRAFDGQMFLCQKN